MYSDLVIRVGPVRVMIHSVGRARDPLHEPECLREILEFEHAVQMSLHHAPAIELDRAALSLPLRPIQVSGDTSSYASDTDQWCLHRQTMRR